MAIIKCPECGHMISDQAPTCPQCGAPIIGHITRCVACGTVYFADKPACPACHHPNVHYTQASNPSSGSVSTATANGEKAVTTQSGSAGSDGHPQPDSPRTEPNKKKKWVPAVSLLIALVVCGVCFYFYKTAKDKRENEAYSYAMTSNDPLVLQSFLDTYGDATAEHRDSIEARLNIIKQMDADWTNAVVSDSRMAFETYIEAHPDSPHKGQALHKIDSLDWCLANNVHTADAYQSYMADHPDGTYAYEALDSIKSIQGKTLRGDERQMIVRTFQLFFQSLNTKSEDALLNCIETPMASFLEKPDAESSDVITFMHKIYKDGVEKISWHVQDDFTITKKNIGVDEYEYAVVVPVSEDVTMTDHTTVTKHFRVKATVNPNGKMTAFNMDQLTQ